MADIRYKHWFEHRNGRLKFDDMKMYRANVTLMEGKRGFIVFYEESENNPVSHGSRAYYFKVLISALAKHSDFYAMSPLQIHHSMMKLFHERMELINGYWVPYTPSMSQFNAKQWHAHVELVEFYMNSKGIIINEITAFIR